MSLETWKRNLCHAGESNKENTGRNSDVCARVSTCEGSVTLSVTTSSLVYLIKRWCSSNSCIFHILNLLSWSKNWKNLTTKPRAGWTKESIIGRETETGLLRKTQGYTEVSVCRSTERTSVSRRMAQLKYPLCYTAPQWQGTVVIYWKRNEIFYHHYTIHIQ